MADFKPNIIDLGGSIVVPDEIDVDYLKKLRELLLPYIDKGEKFILVVGGGHTARVYQKAAGEIIEDVSHVDRDWLGIHATRINAHLLRTIFSDVAYPIVFDSPYKKIDDEDLQNYNLFIGSGGVPGHSTDFDTVEIAHRFEVDKFLIATVTPYVYNKDFKKYQDAKIIKDISWEEYMKLIPESWSPGMKSPVDPVASVKAKEYGISCCLLQGTNIENIKQYLETGEFEGSVIHP